MVGKHWELRGSLPQKPGEHWRSNVQAHIIANTAKRAVELAEEKYPGIEIWSLVHRGQIDIIEDAG